MSEEKLVSGCVAGLQAHVIRCNDSNEVVVIGDESEAQAELEKRRLLYFNRNRHAFSSWESYLSRCYWKIESFDVVHALPQWKPVGWLNKDGTFESYWNDSMDSDWQQVHSRDG